MRRRHLASACLFALLITLLSAAAPASAAPRPDGRGEVLGPATRSSAPTSPAAAAAVPSGFSDTLVFGGLTLPTAIAFAPGGKVFVGEKSGIVKVFDSLLDTTATQVVDLRPKVQDYWDRGLLGLAVDPGFGAGRNFIYVLYTHDFNPEGSPTSWGDGCPSPPGPTTDGCPVTGNLSRIPVDPATGVATGAEQPLITDDWCQQFPSHSIGHLAFGPDGNLYVTGGDGASFNNTDWGQYGGSAGSPTPANPCGDPPRSVGTALSPPDAEGGALRSQSPRRVAGHPILLGGAVLRVDPATGAGATGNPMASSTDANARRIIGYGLRNPFRFTFRPGTSELWVGDVGWNTWEEVNRMTSPTPSTAVNFGWPCYEGAGHQSGYDSANLTICENLYTAGSATGPYYNYNHSASVVSGDGCPTNAGSVISAISFYDGNRYPGAYKGALFFGDHSRNCIWAMLPGGNGLPSSANLQAFVVDPNSHPVDLETDPASGDLLYANFDGGQIRRIQYISGNNPPNAVASANPTSGPAPLTVQFNGSGSSDPDGDALSYSWDLNGEGTYGDSTAANPSFTYTTAGTFSVTLRVTDSRGASSVSAPVTITVGAGNTPPTPVIDSPSSSLTWAVGDTINFSGHATDTQDGPLPASALTWRLIIHHCTTGCHTHTVQTITGVTSGSFTAPDHDYPSYLEIQLTATDSGGLATTTSVDNLQPKTVNLTFQSNPTSLQLTAGPTTARAPFTITAIQNGAIQLIAPNQKYRGKTYAWVSWSDSGAQTHTIRAPATPTTYTATYQRVK
jgi:glucose/arabinose dehydrogenase/PKD repeat protein